MEFCRDYAATHTGIAGEQHPSRRDRRHFGFHSRTERCCLVQGLDRRRIDVPPDAEVNREAGCDAVVVLCKRGIVPVTQQSCIWGVLFERGCLAGYPVRKHIVRGRRRGSSKADRAKVQQIGPEHGLIESELTAKRERVFASNEADHVAQLIVVRARERPRIGRGR